MAENTSPLPQDRVYFDFSSFRNVPLTNSPSSVNSYAAGFEKTFFDGIMSVELRAPMATTLDNDIYFDGPDRDLDGHRRIREFGLAFKTLLLRREKFLLSGGLAMTLPTAQNTQYIFANQFDAPDAFTADRESIRPSDAVFRRTMDTERSLVRHRIPPS